MTEKPRETQAELHVVELKEKVNNSSLMKHQNAALAELFSEYLILSQKILDRVLLVSVDPTGQDQEQQLPGPEHEVHG